MRTTFTGPVQSFPWTNHSDKEKAIKRPVFRSNEFSDQGSGRKNINVPYQVNTRSKSIVGAPDVVRIPEKTCPTCPICLKAFTRKTSLNTHMLIHAYIRPYQCNYESCKKTFNVKSNLNRHLKLHKKQEGRHE